MDTDSTWSSRLMRWFCQSGKRWPVNMFDDHSQNTASTEDYCYHVLLNKNIILQTEQHPDYWTIFFYGQLDGSYNQINSGINYVLCNQLIMYGFHYLYQSYMYLKTHCVVLHSESYYDFIDITITLLIHVCSLWFWIYNFKWSKNKGKVGWTSKPGELYFTQMKITHLVQCWLLWHMVLSVGDYLHKDLLLSHWHSTEKIITARKLKKTPRKIIFLLLMN